MSAKTDLPSASDLMTSCRAWLISWLMDMLPPRHEAATLNATIRSLQSDQWQHMRRTEEFPRVEGSVVVVDLERMIFKCGERYILGVDLARALRIATEETNSKYRGEQQ